MVNIDFDDFIKNVKERFALCPKGLSFFIAS